MHFRLCSAAVVVFAGIACAVACGGAVEHSNDRRATWISAGDGDENMVDARLSRSELDLHMEARARRR